MTEELDTRTEVQIRSQYPQITDKPRWMASRARRHGVTLERIARLMDPKYWDRYERLCEACNGMFTETRPPCCPPVLHVCEDCAARKAHALGTRAHAAGRWG